MSVFVLDKNKKPLMPCSEKRARLLLQRGRAVVHRMIPFTIRLRDRKVEDSELQSLELKFDPGSKTSGFAVLRHDDEEVSSAIILGEIKHKTGIKKRLAARRAVRRNRRQRHTRYRKCRFENRGTKLRDCKICGGNTPKRRDAKGKPIGGRESLCRKCKSNPQHAVLAERTRKLPPSLRARVNQTIHCVKKIMKLTPISALASEFVKFDTQLMQNESISGVEYQQGTLYGYEIREYLLEKFKHQCAYCHGESGDSKLEIEHYIPKNPKQGSPGTDHISNLAIACHTCNQEKGNLQPEEWLMRLKVSKRTIDQVRFDNFQEIEKQLKKPLRDAAMMNATRYELVEHLKSFNVPVFLGTGARTKMQRIEHNLPKAHYYDACCVAKTPKQLTIKTTYVWIWQAMGRGNRERQNKDKYGFPIGEPKMKPKRSFGFQTGDIVKACIPNGKFKGIHTGRIAVRKRSSFKLNNFDVHPKYLQLLQRGDGWNYNKVAGLHPHA